MRLTKSAMRAKPARLVEVAPSKYGGLGLMSRRNFEKGDVVLVETPFLTVLVPATSVFLCPKARTSLCCFAHRRMFKRLKWAETRKNLGSTRCQMWIGRILRALTLTLQYHPPKYALQSQSSTRRTRAAAPFFLFAHMRCENVGG